ncbi:MAG: alanine--tRNA ligase [Candidatus Kapaibacterium sp.]|jgi:alanyl-tRNA synthetase
MTSDEIRLSFLNFFRERGHTIVPGAPVIPHGDKTLLFTNAGMNQFKDVFLGEGTRAYTRAADTQRCIRVSGKHNDLEEVGHDTYHHTLFEMLGNWSFGDYYKKEAIGWAWELLTKVWGLDKTRLYATVFETDEEAEKLWQSETDIDPAHILRFGAKDNFWEMGDTGPCGPCSEIHYDLTADKSGKKLVNASSPEVIEIWNLVFIQYNRSPDGTLEPLTATHVDTGMGFERACAVLQGKKSNYDTDVFAPYLAWLSKRSGIPYGEKPEADIAMRVIADHIRTLSSAIADGAMPGNEGRGYVLRRILRRAARYGRKLDFREPFLFELASVVADTMGDVFPELRERLGLIERVVKAEEESFNVTLDRGLALFEEIARAAEDSESPSISGEMSFKLYDTFGFPIDLTEVLARERGLEVDMERFHELLQEQKDRSLRVHASKKQIVQATIELNDIHSAFTGYDTTEDSGRALVVEGNTLVLDRTPFYAESGGQIADTGVITIEGRDYPVKDVRKIGDAIAHVLEEDAADVAVGDVAHGVVNRERRQDIIRNHSATHLMHAALRQVLGDHVHQSGSLVTDDRLRFDFAHYQKVTPEELREIESIVNAKIRESIRLIHHRNIPFDDAKKMGAMMFFGDKYGARVNVVDFGPFSREFCGGVHVHSTAEIGLFKFISESSIASGVRRVEAVTGKGVEQWILESESKYSDLSKEFEHVEEEKRRLEKEMAKLRLDARKGELVKLAASATPLEGSTVRVLAHQFVVSDAEELKALGEMLRDELKLGAVAVIGATFGEDKVSLVAMVSDDLIKEKKLQAGKLVSSIAELVGGKGGGRPQLAQAGGKDASQLAGALKRVPGIVREALGIAIR